MDAPALAVTHKVNSFCRDFFFAGTSSHRSKFDRSVPAPASAPLPSVGRGGCQLQRQTASGSAFSWRITRRFHFGAAHSPANVSHVPQRGRAATPACSLLAQHAPRPSNLTPRETVVCTLT